MINENAKHKKKELEDKITKMAMVDNILSAHEAKEKIELLEQNFELLKITGDADSPTYRSRIRDLEHQLGVSILEDENDVATLKDQMRETKGTFKKNQEQAEAFVNKISENKRKNDQKFSKAKKKEMAKYKKIEESRVEEMKLREDKLKAQKDKLVENKHERQEAEKLAKQKRDEEWKKFVIKKKQNKDHYLHEKLEKEYNEKVIMPELEKKKLALKEKREFHKPIDHREIDEFQKQYEDRIKLKIEEKRVIREKWYDDIGA